MFDHVTLRVSERGASERFYRRVLATLGIEMSYSGADLVEWSEFSLVEAGDGEGVTRRLHVGFIAPSRAHVDAFWRTGIEAGSRDDGAPGPRAEYGNDYYGGFLLDAEGNSVEAVHHERLWPDGAIDHLWIRVLDLDASTRFYETVAPHAGFARVPAEPGRSRFRRAGGSFTLLEGAATQHVHLAFGAPDRGTVGTFHRALMAAGHRDNGAPGERPRYHPGYHAAYVLDPDGNNVEVVHHERDG